MASTYSDLKIQLMTTGENLSTWGTVTNTNLGTALEEAIAGSADVSFSSADVTLTLSNTNASQTARNMRLNLTGTSGGARVLNVPAIEKMYVVNNGLADACTVKVSGQTGVSVPAGKTMILYNNGTDVVDAVTHLSSLTLATALPVASGGTGANTASAARTSLGLGTIATQNASAVTITGGSITGITDLAVADGGTGASTLTANNVILGNGTSAVQFVAPGTAGNVLTSNGTTWTSGAAFVTGMIMLWSGSIASVPSGWALCNGSNGTPDLRDRFVVGAGNTYSVGGTGGSADAIVVAHTHSASSTSNVTDPTHDHTMHGQGPIDGYGGVYLSNDNTAFSGGGGSPFGQSSTPDTDMRTSLDSTGITVSTTTTVSSSGSSGTNANLPPYYALAYIMKL